MLCLIHTDRMQRCCIRVPGYESSEVEVQVTGSEDFVWGCIKGLDMESRIILFWIRVAAIGFGYEDFA